jgi:hypothetical protein
MENSQIVHEIDRAKDSFGVITPDSAHTQLSSFSAADWQQAAKIYAQDPAKPDGFSIQDNNGQVSIHNDMTKAHQIGDNSVLSTTLDDAKTIAAVTGSLLGIAIPSAGLTAAGFGETAEGAPMAFLSAAAGDAALGAMGSMALYGGAAAAIITGAIAGGDAVRNVFRKADAQQELANDSVVNLSAPLTRAG